MNAPRSGPRRDEPFERAADAPGVADQVVRRGRLQHEPAHALVQHVGVTDGERLHRHPAHRVTDEDHVAQVEALEHAAEVVGEVVDRVAGVAGHRLAVPAGVEGDGAEPGGGERLELLRPHARRERDAVAEHHRRPVSPRDGVDRAAVVAVEDAHGVELGDQRVAGVGIVAVAQARDERALRRVGDADGARGHAGDDPGALQRPRRHQTGRFRCGVPAIRPRLHCISIDRRFRRLRIRPHCIACAGTRGADAGDDLVRDGAEARRPLGGGDLVVALAADEHDLVVERRRARRRGRRAAGPS